MTFRERLAKEHPESVGSHFVGGCRECLCTYGYEEGTPCRIFDDEQCRGCWNRKMPMTPEEQEKHDLEINAEIIRGYCDGFIGYTCDECPVEDVCRNGLGRWSAGFASASAAEQRAMLDAFEAALPPLDEEDGGRPQAAPTACGGCGRQPAAPTEENATPERKDVRERLDFLFWEASAKLKAWYETRDGEELEQAVWLLRWMTEIQEGEG